MFEKINENKKYLFLTAIIVSFLTVLPTLINYIFVDKDLTFHIYRIQEMTTNVINDNIWLPALQGNNLFGYGYLVDVFYPNLFLYPALIINLFIKNPLTSFKILIFLYSIFTFYMAYYSSKMITKHNLFSLYFAIFYVLYPYRILSLYENGFVGEFFAYAFIPLVIYGVHNLFKNNKWKMLAIGMIGILYSHLITLLLASFYITIYMIFNFKLILKNKNIIINLFKTTITTIVIGSAFLLPFISQMLSDNYKFNLNAEISGILSYGLFELPLIIEIIIQIVIIFLCIYIYKKYKNKTKNSNIIKCYIICIYAILMITKIFPWELFEYIPFAKNIQFSIRIFSFISPFVVFLFSELSLVLKDMDKVFTYCFVAIVFTYMTISLAKSFESENFIINYNKVYAFDERFQENTFLDIVAGEYVPSDFSVNDLSLLDISNEDLLNCNKIEFDKKVINYEFKNDNSLTSYLMLETNDTVNISFPLTYYKNYNAYLNGEKIEIYEQDGRILLKNIPSGKIKIEYEISDLQLYTFLISFISSIIFVLFIIYEHKKLYKNTKI